MLTPNFLCVAKAMIGRSRGPSPHILLIPPFAKSAKDGAPDRWWLGDREKTDSELAGSYHFRPEYFDSVGCFRAVIGGGDFFRHGAQIGSLHEVTQRGSNRM
jgi:hypothetical protein